MRPRTTRTYGAGSGSSAWTSPEHLTSWPDTTVERLTKASDPVGRLTYYYAPSVVECGDEILDPDQEVEDDDA